MNKPFNLLAGFAVLALLAVQPAVAANADIEMLRKEFSGRYLQGTVKESEVRKILDTFNPKDSLWPDIDYADVRRVAFHHGRHLTRLITLSRAYVRGDSPFYHDPQIRQTIDKGLDFWLAHDFISDNWHDNEIGTPGSLIAIMYIMDGQLSARQLERMAPIIGRAHENAWGARQSGDRIKIIGLEAQTAVFNRNEKSFDHLIKIIEGEAQFAPVEKDSPYGRGLQRDYSFHHRTDRVNNTLSYGYGYVQTFADWASLMSGTHYHFSEGTIKLLVDYYLDGICKQLVYGRSKDPALYNREIARVANRMRIFSVSVPENFLKAASYRADELKNIVRARKDQSVTPLSYAKFFWQTEYFSFQRPHFFTSVRMHSTRNRTMEASHNDEGLLNHYRADGTSYLSLKGDEYIGTPPVYDFRKIPGTTIMQTDQDMYKIKVQKVSKSEFVGGVDDGLYGAAVFDFISPIDSLKARKSWFFFDTEYVCLGAGITGDADFPVVTTMEQNRLQGKVNVQSVGGSAATLETGDRKLNAVEWVHHNNTGYIFPEAVDAYLSNQKEEGSWARLSRQLSTPKGKVTVDMFKLWIDHGSRPTDAAYAYVVVPAADLKTVEKAAKSLPVTILSNTPKLQAVQHDRAGIAYGVFYEPGTMTAGKLTVGLDAPGMVMVRYDKQGKVQSVSVSDPSRKLQKLDVTVNRKIEKSGKNHRSAWDAGKGVSTLSIDLPQDVGTYAGQSVTIAL